MSGIDERSRLYPERGPGKSFPMTTLKKTFCIIVFILPLAMLVALGFGLAMKVVQLKNLNNEILRDCENSSSKRDICFTPTCIYEAANLLKSMNTSVDPCTDFYSFACGNLIKNSYLTSSMESQFTKLSETIRLRVKEILEELEKEEGLPPNKQKIADYYTACMDKIHRNELGAAELASDLKKFGGWPLIEEDWRASNFDWADMIIELFKDGYMYNMLFAITVDVDFKNTSKSILAVNQPSLGLKNRLYYVLPETDLIHSYKEVIFKFAKLLRGDIDKEKSRTDIEAAFKIEEKIAHLLKDDDMSRHPDTFSNITRLEDLEIFAPKIPWRKIFTNFLPADIIITGDERIMIIQPDYFAGLNKILEEMDNDIGKRTLSNYMFYRIVLNAAHFLSEEFRSLLTALFEGAAIGSMPWEDCAKIILELLPFPLTASYAKRYTDNTTKEALGIMVEDIRKSLAEDIKSSHWLDAKTKSYALLKVKKLKATIGYQDEILDDDNLDRYYENVNITDNHFANIKQMIAFRLRQTMKALHEKRDSFRWFEFDNLLTANAFYRPTVNTIIIPVGVLEDTVFATGRPNYINYGSLGMIVGHELTHAFDSIGSLYDAEGNYRMWWSEKSWKVFEEKMKCYEEQYGNYFVPAANASVNGSLTLAENVADNGGLRAAYQAYNTLLTRIGSEKSLPGLQYTERQMFWIAFGSVWCRKQTDESIQYTVTHSTHTTAKFRIIGSLSNIKEFSEDFKCKFNSTLSPASKCTLWK